MEEVDALTLGCRVGYMVLRVTVGTEVEWKCLRMLVLWSKPSGRILIVGVVNGVAGVREDGSGWVFPQAGCESQYSCRDVTVHSLQPTCSHVVHLW